MNNRHRVTRRLQQPTPPAHVKPCCLRSVNAVLGIAAEAFAARDLRVAESLIGVLRDYDPETSAFSASAQALARLFAGPMQDGEPQDVALTEADLLALHTYVRESTTVADELKGWFYLVATRERGALVCPGCGETVRRGGGGTVCGAEPSEDPCPVACMAAGAAWWPPDGPVPDVETLALTAAVHEAVSRGA